MTPSEHRFMTFVALREPATISPDRLVEAIRERTPALAPHMNVISAGADTSESFIIQAGPLAVTIISVPQPVPKGTFDQAVELARTWPDAGKALARHRAHIIIGSLRPVTDHAGAVAQARVVSLITAAVCALTPAIGVYWSSGQVVTETGAFQEEVTTKDFPFETWISFRWLDGPRTSKGERTLAVITNGLLPFVGREIEFQPVPLSPAEIALRVLGTIHVLLAKGPVLKDGDTVGISPAEHIRVRHANHGQRRGVPVLALSVEQIAGSPEK
ncbi:DUF4261 domain-containing protein [uncultured Gammaproteobacteria bacterium]